MSPSPRSRRQRNISLTPPPILVPQMRRSPTRQSRTLHHSDARLRLAAPRTAEVLLARILVQEVAVRCACCPLTGACGGRKRIRLHRGVSLHRSLYSSGVLARSRPRPAAGRTAAGGSLALDQPVLSPSRVCLSYVHSVRRRCAPPPGRRTGASASTRRRSVRQRRYQHRPVQRPRAGRCRPAG